MSARTRYWMYQVLAIIIFLVGILLPIAVVFFSPTLGIPAIFQPLAFVTMIPATWAIHRLISKTVRELPVRDDETPFSLATPSVTQTDLERIRRFEAMSPLKRYGSGVWAAVIGGALFALTYAPITIALPGILFAVGIIVPASLTVMVTMDQRMQQWMQEAKYAPQWLVVAYSFGHVFYWIGVGALAVLGLVMIFPYPIGGGALLIGLATGHLVIKPLVDKSNEQLIAEIDGKAPVEF